MPIGKKIHEVFSGRHAERGQRLRALSPEQVNVVAPYDNYKNNVPTFGKSNNRVNILQEKREISPTEGIPAVNGQSGLEVVEKFVTPVQAKAPLVDAGEACIIDITKPKKKGGRPKKNKEEK